ncbi:hypothetical protein BS50DRAFT_578180 [Corynespora cassiicola Philippines]|uniref:ADP-ribose 1''-phosphate phosphatase n=1 Tax=Corynespora cassiicola Philippines TaxID=1448308 RepID=A0A2T2N865_CORCC|nr:hypothetical protein BS50DRAFT_578180 [Corynespora cassiicola Philippines]
MEPTTPNKAQAADTSDTPSGTPSKPRLSLSIYKGNIFAAPPQTLLIHACNTQGSWSAGIALAFKQRYPEAFKIYRAYCTLTHNPSSNPVRIGTCLLIPPAEKDGKPKHWIGCLFTSAKYGKRKDPPAVIVANTAPAMKDCFKKVKQVGGAVRGVRLCKINSARFRVPWERTLEALEGIEIEEGWFGKAEVWTIDED